MGPLQGQEVPRWGQTCNLTRAHRAGSPRSSSAKRVRIPVICHVRSRVVEDAHIMHILWVSLGGGSPQVARCAKTLLAAVRQDEVSWRMGSRVLVQWLIALKAMSVRRRGLALS